MPTFHKYHFQLAETPNMNVRMLFRAAHSVGKLGWIKYKNFNRAKHVISKVSFSAESEVA